MRRTAGIVALGALLLAAGCGQGTTHHSLIGDTSPLGAAVGATTTLPTTTTTTSTTVPPAPTTVAPAPTTTAAPSAPPRPYAVGTTTFDLTDTSRTAAGKPRHLPTLVFYPATGSDPTAETANATPLGHSWPLVVFAHGYNVTPLTYHDLLHHMAEMGYVVAAPSFPLETEGGPLDENDLSNEPGDIKFVITQVLGASNTPGGLLSGMINSSKIAAVGHSDGGEAVLGVAFLPGQSDNRIGPVVAMAAQAILNGNSVSAAPVRHPLLVVQGSADTINPPARGDAVFASAPTPKAYLRLIGAGHLPPIADANQWRPVVEATVVDWLDAWFGGPNSVGVANRLGHDANVAGTSSIQLG